MVRTARGTCRERHDIFCLVEDAVAIRKDGPLCFKRVDLPVGRSILELGLGHSQLASKATKLKRSCQETTSETDDQVRRLVRATSVGNKDIGSRSALRGSKKTRNDIDSSVRTWRKIKILETICFRLVVKSPSRVTCTYPTRVRRSTRRAQRSS